ncbi:uncharacterized protein LOC129946593 [Eupeodes corollae]|uniref:uncharacterized protein LOC129946593 n=1 Tax=Eupeodes corollae TaxID=290404 RepID=UPI0024929112|nr:uncharacterized protein LOC129946593 [Eupeodes corollae]XP_055912817.1 uncharacterized protein LOC129946593 [Eupeodes corollae]
MKMTKTGLCNMTSVAGILLLVLIEKASGQITQTRSIRTSSSSSPNQDGDVSKTSSTFITNHEEFLDEHNQPHSRKKRLVWITDDGRLALPPGTSLTFTPTIALPLVRHPPEGFFSNLTISFPVTIDFDKLGLTDNQNPLGDLPPIFARSFGHSAGEVLGGYMARYLNYKKKRDLSSQETQFSNNEPEDEEESEEMPKLPERFKHIFHGGERVMLYGAVETFLSTFGMDGKACLLRTICEVHSRSLDHFGIFGEMTKLFLTVKKSPFANLIPEYVKAQEIGEGKEVPGECFPYYKGCPKSIFKALITKKYSNEEHSEYHEQEAEEINEIKENSPSNFPKKRLVSM